MAKFFLKYPMQTSFLFRPVCFFRYFLCCFLILVSVVNLGFAFPLPGYAWLYSLFSPVIQLIAVSYFCCFFMIKMIYNVLLLFLPSFFSFRLATVSALFERWLGVGLAEISHLLVYSHVKCLWQLGLGRQKSGTWNSVWASTLGTETQWLVPSAAAFRDVR